MSTIPCKPGQARCDPLSYMPGGEGVVIEETEVTLRLLINLFRDVLRAPTLAERLLAPGGRLIGTAGKSVGVRFLGGGLEAAQKMMARLLSGGATRLTPVGSVAEKFALKEGGVVALRTVSSTPEVVATIDVDIPHVAIHELKFNP